MSKKANQPPIILIKFANLIFLLISLFFLFVSIYCGYRILFPIYEYALSYKEIDMIYIVVILLSVLLTCFSFLSITKMNKNLQVNLSIIFFILGICIIGFEGYLEFNTKKNPKIILANKFGIPYDTRTPLEVIKDLEKKNITALPHMHGYYWLEEIGFSTKSGQIYPFGAVSNSKTILHNQLGFYPLIKFDEYGFHNPSGLYNKKNIDIMLSGDSFVEGYAVNSDENIASVLRDSKFNAISLGKGGNGPLLEYAILREYAKPFKPKIVLWFYFANDLNNLSYEMQSPILKEYLKNENYTQNLIKRQKEIDKVLMGYAEIRWKIQSEKKWEREKFANYSIIKIIKLYNIRSLINLIPTGIYKEIDEFNFPSQKFTSTPIDKIFRDIMKKSSKLVSEWDGKMYFVFLPSYGRYAKNFKHNFSISNREDILSIISELDIPIIDIHKDVFSEHSEPLSLFPFKMNGHYTAEGYRLTAKAIEKRLVADGY